MINLGRNANFWNNSERRAQQLAPSTAVHNRPMIVPIRFRDTIVADIYEEDVSDVDIK